MIDEQSRLWNMFTQSGNIADYLKYKGIYNCGDSAECVDSGISCEEPHFCNQNLESGMKKNGIIINS